MNERVKFIVRLKSGERMTDLCKEFEISRKTGYKFLDRYKAFGVNGLFDETRRPERLARSYPEETKQLVLEAKRRHLTWGAKKLFQELKNREPGVKLPREGTMHNWLAQNGLVKKRRRRYRSDLNRMVEGKSNQANDIWCADFKGKFKVGDGRYCYPLTISDHYSRYLISCEGLEKPDGLGSLGVFEAAFRQYGLPQAIRTDNGTPFVGRGIGGLSKLSIWWLKLGIKIQRIEPGHPEQNGRHERMHLTLKQETTRPTGKNLLQQQERFDNFVNEYNNARPHEALQMKYPCDVYQASSKPFQEEVVEPKYPLHDIVKTVSPGGMVSFLGRNKSFFLGTALTGEKVGFRELKNNKWLVSFMNIDLGYLNGDKCSFESIV